MSFLAALIAVGLVLAMLGPFGTYADLEAGTRIAYWVSLVVVNGMQTQALYLATGRVLPRRRWPEPVVVTVSSAIASGFGTVEVLWLESLVRPSTLKHASTAEIYLSVFLVTAIVTALFAGPLRRWTLVAEQEAQAGPAGGGETHDQACGHDVPARAEAAGNGKDAKPPFFDRIPERLGRELLCLQMEDHYVRVHTELGDDLILMRMRDAVGELEGYDGLQVHRSYWVARRAIVDVARVGERAVLTLVNGLEVPVSRRRMQAAREHGLLDL